MTPANSERKKLQPKPDNSAHWRATHGPHPHARNTRRPAAHVVSFPDVCIRYPEKLMGHF